jgi:uncharacterized membrane protein
MKRLFEEQNIRLAFEISLVLKGLLAILEIICGVLVYFVTQQFLLSIVLAITQEELAEDRHDLVAQYLIHSVQSFSISSQHFASFYLLSHGIIKTILIAGLLRKKLLFYPVAIIVFGLFIVYQLYRFSLTHSPWLVLITVLDIVVIWLTWYEYRFLRNGLRGLYSAP